MTEDAKQRTLEGLVVTSRDALKEAVREVLREEGILGAAKAASKWDRKPKGDVWWLEFRAHVVRLLYPRVAIAYRDLDKDPYFARTEAFKVGRQWDRAIDQHLVPDKPHGDDDLELATFSLSPRTGRYLTARSWMHCAIAHVADRHQRRDPALVRKVRAEYQSEAACDRCRPGHARAEVSHHVPQEETGVTNSVSVTLEDGGDPLSDEERAILRACPEQSPGNRRAGTD